MAWAQADQQRFGAEHLRGNPGRFGDQAAGEGHIDVAADDSDGRSPTRPRTSASAWRAIRPQDYTQSVGPVSEKEMQ